MCVLNRCKHRYFGRNANNDERGIPLYFPHRGRFFFFIYLTRQILTDSEIICRLFSELDIVYCVCTRTCFTIKRKKNTHTHIFFSFPSGGSIWIPRDRLQIWGGGARGWKSAVVVVGVQGNTFDVALAANFNQNSKTSLHLQVSEGSRRLWRVKN